MPIDVNSALVSISEDCTISGANCADAKIPHGCNIFGANHPSAGDTGSPEMRAKANALYCGDNLVILREHIADESIDLVYLDPPFNSQQDYNVIFRDKGGKRSTSQELVFEDTWEWSTNADETCRELIEGGGALSHVIRAFRLYLEESRMMAYLVMMAPRLVELRRVLRPTGSIYLHCDPTMSHYLKILMDAIFGPQCYRNEIIWKRTGAHNDARRFADIYDCILYYVRTPGATWNPQYLPHNAKYLRTHYNRTDSQGRAYRLDNIIRSKSMGPRPNLCYEYKGYTPQWGWRVLRNKLEAIDAAGRLAWSGTGIPYLVRFLDEMKGSALPSLWDDIAPVNSQAQERLGYPTQKPQALLERIIQASSKQGDVILDPFCGCGTSIEASEKLGRRWIGIDITHLALAIIKHRLSNRFGFPVFKDIAVGGEPVNIDEALALAEGDKFGFQCWAVGRLGAPPIEHRKGADRGIDGRIYFHDDYGAAKEIIISVKAGEHIGPAFVRELRGVVEREKAGLGILVCVKEPTHEMELEAKRAGTYRSINGVFPKLQIVTLTDIFANKSLNIPGRLNPYERKRPSSARPIAEQLRLLP